MLGCVVQMIITTDDMRNFHVRVIDNNHEVIDEAAIRSTNNEILEQVVRECDIAE